MTDIERLQAEIARLKQELQAHRECLILLPVCMLDLRAFQRLEIQHLTQRVEALERMNNHEQV